MSPKGKKKRFQTKGRVIFFVTGNINKFNEARQVLADYNVAVGMLKIKPTEIQGESLEEIAKASAIDAFDKCHLPIIVEDAGLFVDSLDGFPGPYAAYVYRTVGNAGLLNLMRNVESRKAHFESTVAYMSEELDSPKCFNGQVQGEIASEEKKGNCRSGFGFDPVFRPINSSIVFAEMSIEEKNMHSHRARAFRSFAEWYTR